MTEVNTIFNSGDHYCAAKGCHKIVASTVFMCKIHWKMVPYEMQKAIWAAYVKGQTVGTLTEEYKEAAVSAIMCVADLENKE